MGGSGTDGVRGMPEGDAHLVEIAREEAETLSERLEELHREGLDVVLVAHMNADCTPTACRCSVTHQDDPVGPVMARSPKKLILRVKRTRTL